MGIDAYFAIRFKEPPTETQIKHLRFHLIHRFGSILDWRNHDKTKPLRPLITKATHNLGDWDDISAEDGCLYQIDTLMRLYDQGYERGPGLEISSLLIFLCRHTWISAVYYGGDGRLREYSEDDALALFNHWIVHGELPYRMGHHATEGGPVCEWCEMPMVWGGGSRDVHYWHCVACGNKAETPRK